jgi:hypothetical protein
VTDHERYPDCVLDTCRHFDSSTGEWVYEVACLEPPHPGCPGDRELFRERRAS